MENLNIVEYTPAYAKAVAEMWRRSAEGWNGRFADTTEEKILKDLEGSTSLNIYLAELNGEILGYCDFSQYLLDEGALYIKWLNARYDYHGKGIGRTLVCKAIERTVELGWPRLDLQTWPGNTKSIPLYKRCGFFMEEASDSTHFMNFIPYVLKTEAVEEFFENVHWYKYLKRNIDMNPDGRIENGFCYYEYLWEKNERTLKMEFERLGRGLSMIEESDYLIKAYIPQQDLILGQKYKITYEIINKSHRPLIVSIKGRNDKNIIYNFQTAIEVNEKEKIEGEFYVDEFQQETNPLKTHPAVISEIFINGKKAEFKLGVIPKLPAAISLVGTEALTYTSNPECFKNAVSEIYINIENNFNEEAVFKFNLLDTEDIEFLNKEFEVTLKGRERG